jgi:hypothetical protein
VNVRSLVDRRVAGMGDGEGPGRGDSITLRLLWDPPAASQRVVVPGAADQDRSSMGRIGP